MDNFVEPSSMTYIKYSPSMVEGIPSIPEKRSSRGAMLLAHRCNAHVFKVLRIPYAVEAQCGNVARARTS